MRGVRTNAALLAALMLCLLVASAAAKDSHAPAKAGDRWLPCEPWVMYHWLPFDSEALYRELGVTRERWHEYISADDDHRTLAKFIDAQGKDPERVVKRLMRRWDGRVSAKKRAELDRRAGELLTQGHLAQHVFFHYFHHPMIGIRAEYIFGVSPMTFHEARMRGFSPREIAEHGGVPISRAVRRAFRVLRQSQDEGVRSGQTSREQANRFLRGERRWVRRWLNQSLRRHNRAFPHSKMKMTGTRDVQACQHMVGPKHVPGPNEPADVKQYFSR